jgi:hypothetical protein
MVFTADPAMLFDGCSWNIDYTRGFEDPRARSKSQNTVSNKSLNGTRLRTIPDFVVGIPQHMAVRHFQAGLRKAYSVISNFAP